MLTVVEITPAASKAGHFCVRLSSGETLTCTTDTLLAQRLSQGTQLSDESYSELVDEINIGKAKERALRIISARAFSEREMYDRLIEKGCTEQAAAAAVAWLLDMHFLDDSSYAEGIVRHYMAKGYGIRRIKDELYRRKLPKELWDDALAQLFENDSAEETIDRLLASKLSHNDNPDRSQLKKAQDALLRRGFTYDEIRSAIERYLRRVKE